MSDRKLSPFWAAGGQLTEELWRPGHRASALAAHERREALAERNAAIIAAVQAGRSQADVAAEFGISQGQVSEIVRRANGR